MENKDYHSDFQFITSSQLKYFLRSSLAYKTAKDNKQKGIETDSEAMKLGRVFHSFMEGVENYKIFDIENRPNKDKGITSIINQDWKKTELESHENVITLDQLTEIKAMVDSVKTSTFYKSFISVLEFSGDEQTYTAELLGQKCKMRADRIYNFGDDTILVVDWKTTRDNLTKDRNQYLRLIKKMNYDISMVHYCEILKKETGKNIQFCFVFVEKSEPFDCMPIFIDCENSELYQDAKSRWVDLMLRAKWHIENNIFEGVNGCSYELANSSEQDLTEVEIINKSYINL